LIALQDYTKYARQSDSDIFKQLSGVLSWGDFFGEADGYNEAFGCFGRDYSLAAVLFERHSLQGHTAPSRKTGQKVAGTIKVGSGTRGYPDPSDGNGGGMIACETSDTLSVGANQTTGFIGDVVAHSLRAEGFDASEDGTGRGTPVVALQSVNCPRQQKQNGIGISNADVMYSCTSRDLHGIQSGMQVRRLTPRECERLQGFPDDYTQVPYRGHASADGPRYKALGNSMAVPVVRWIGERIKATGTICAGIAAAGAAGEASTACNSGVVPGKKKKMQNN
jgi:DNA (cytosine-5)-methyltransferase 1